MSRMTFLLVASVSLCGGHAASAQLLQPHSVQPITMQVGTRSIATLSSYRLIQADEPVMAEVTAPDSALPSEEGLVSESESDATPSDATPTMATPTMVSADCGGCREVGSGCTADGCGCSSTFRGTVLGCRKCRGRLFSAGDRLGVKFGGWLASGNTINSHGLRTPGGNEPMGFNNYANGWVLNQAWVWAERAADTGGRGFDWGFRVDFMFGADGPDTQAFGDGGWDDSWDTSSQYGFAMPQLYGELMFNETKVKIGHFYTIIGYEVVQAPNNFFYSHALSHYYTESFTHTGFLAERPLGRGGNVTGYAGWTMGWDSGFDNRFDGSTFLGGLSARLTDDINLIWATTFGDRGYNSDTYMQSVVADVRLSDRTNYIFQTDWQRTDFGAGDEDCYGVDQYLLHTINRCWAIGTRLEWFRDNSGNYIGNGPGSYWDWTVGLNRTGWRGMVNRVEVRYDWFDGLGQPYANGTKRSQVTLATSTYITF